MTSPHRHLTRRQRLDVPYGAVDDASCYAKVPRPGSPHGTQDRQVRHRTLQYGYVAVSGTREQAVKVKVRRAIAARRLAAGGGRLIADRKGRPAGPPPAAE